MMNTAPTRLPAATPRHALSPELVGELRADKGPKNVGFDAHFLGAGRRAMERAEKLDKKR